MQFGIDIGIGIDVGIGIDIGIGIMRLHCGVGDVACVPRLRREVLMKSQRAHCVVGFLMRLVAFGAAAATLLVSVSLANVANAAGDVTGDSAGAAGTAAINGAATSQRKGPQYIDPDFFNSVVNNPANNAAAANRPVTVIVTLKKQPHKPSTQAESSNKSAQTQLINRWSSKYGLSVRRQFGYLMNGFEATIPGDAIDALRKEPEVASVAKERLYYPLANVGSASSSASGAQNIHEIQGVTQAFKAAHKNLDGRGMVISIIDSGIDIKHKDMRIDDDARSAEKLRPIAGFNEKVPAGFNYADENYDVKDVSSIQHGMHVAGIAAAHGCDSDGKCEMGRIDGAAPNAQLLAMKVFSNKPNPGPARDADIVAAIEDSVKLGADVINLSLGSSNGFSGNSNATSYALRKALEAGVLPIVSAGNFGSNFSWDRNDISEFGKLDNGTLGMPASYPAVFTVASVENSTVMNPSGYYVDSKGKHTIAYSCATGSFDSKEHEIVNVGLGRVSDFKNRNVSGKYVLIERGEITYKEKFDNAKKAGASGVVIYNKANNPDLFLGMDGVNDFTFFSASIRREDGLKIAEAIKNSGSGTAGSGSVKVSFGNDIAPMLSPKALRPSVFSSWGPTPELDFKPQITGVGGNVWSTQNNNGYINMSGTSMAAPSIAGFVALMLENYKSREGKAVSVGLVARVRQALMNTAKILTHDGSESSEDEGNNNESDTGVPYAPRQIGAGLVQLNKALATNVIATVKDNSDGKNKAYVSLRELTSGSHSFTVTLRNYGSKAVTYNIPQQRVVNERRTSERKVTTFINTAETLTANATSVTVAPKATATVTFTLNPQYGHDHYIEGWARFKSQTEGQPDLSVPYLGFVGNWNAEPILVKPGENYSSSITMTTSLTSSFHGKTVQVGDGSNGTVVFSPKYMSELKPSLALLRNVELLKYSVLDSKGNLLEEIGEDHYVSRPTLYDLGAPNGLVSYIGYGAFDGKIYNKKSKTPAEKFKALPEGSYIYRVKACITKNRCQVTDMPFTISSSVPKIQVTIDDFIHGTLINLHIKSHSNLSKTLSKPGVRINGSREFMHYDARKACRETHDSSGTTLNCNIPLGSRSKKAGSSIEFVDVYVHDAGFNEAHVKKVLKAGKDGKIGKDGFSSGSQVEADETDASNSADDPNDTFNEYSLYLNNASSYGGYKWRVNGVGSDGKFTVDGGIDVKNVTQVIFTPANRVKNDGSEYANPQSIEATIQHGRWSSNTFKAQLPIHTGVNDFRLVVKNGDQTLLDTPAVFYFDNQPPVVTFTAPTKLYAGRLFTKGNSVKFSGTISDDFAGYTLKISNLIAADNSTEDSKGAITNKQSFERELPVEDGDFVLIQAMGRGDYSGNVISARFPVVVDNTAPTVEFGVKNHEKVDGNKNIVVKAQDANLRSLVVKVDGVKVGEAAHTLNESLLQNMLTQGNPYDIQLSKMNLDKPLQVTVDPKKIASGKHTITVEAVDYAGNVAKDNSIAFERAADTLASTDIVVGSQGAVGEAGAGGAGNGSGNGSAGIGVGYALLNDLTYTDGVHENGHAGGSTGSLHAGKEGKSKNDGKSGASNSVAADRKQNGARAKVLTSKLAVTGSGVVAAIVTFVVLLISGLTLTARRSRHARNSSRL